MDLNSMDINELKTLKRDVDKAVASYEDRRLQEARHAIEAQAREMGYSLSELLGGAKKIKSISAPKYRHPENPDLTWTGKGRRPKWIIEAQNRGVDIATMEI
jgi:DNA-binding protein H-NS